MVIHGHVDPITINGRTGGLRTRSGDAERGIEVHVLDGVEELDALKSQDFWAGEAARIEASDEAILEARGA